MGKNTKSVAVPKNWPKRAISSRHSLLNQLDKLNNLLWNVKWKTPGGGGVPGLIFAGYGLSELLPRYSLFCGQL